VTRKLRIPCFNKDNIKEVIGDGFGANNIDVHNIYNILSVQFGVHIFSLAYTLTIAKTAKICYNNFSQEV